jgi:hypothetical protein
LGYKCLCGVTVATPVLGAGAKACQFDSDHRYMQEQIEIEIRKAISRHLVLHVDVPKDDRRDRIVILAEEAAIEIMKIVENGK